MVDIVTLIIATSGLILSAIYICLSSSGGGENEKIKRETLDNIKKIGKNEQNKLLSDYEITNHEIERREHITLLIGTILIVASFLIFSESIGRGEPTPIAALASIGLYFLWLFVLHLSTKRLDDMAYARIRAIEERLSGSDLANYEFGIHSFFRNRERWWMCIRRSFWGWTYMLLSLCWLFFSLVSA